MQLYIAFMCVYQHSKDFLNEKSYSAVDNFKFHHKTPHSTEVKLLKKESYN